MQIIPSRNDGLCCRLGKNEIWQEYMTHPEESIYLSLLRRRRRQGWAGKPSMPQATLPLCRGGLVICCLNTVATVKAKLRQGETVHRELLQR